MNLSAYFLAPAFLGLLGLLPVVVLLYLLKLRRTPVVIPSTLLWQKSLHDLTANAPFQRLRRNLLLLLQLIVLAALAFGMARPFFKAQGIQGGNICLLIDRSASMNSVEDDGKSRLEQAKTKALALVDQLSGGDKMMVVSFARNAEVLCELTDDQRRLRAAVAAIEGSDTVTRVRDAVFVANSLGKGMLPGTTGLKTIILSDGRIEDLDQIGARAFDVTFVRVGQTSANAGIVAFSLRAPTEGQPDAERQCLVLVRNEDETPLAATLTLSLDEQTLAVEELQIPAKDSGEVLFSLPGAAAQSASVLRAQLDVDDVLAADNTAWLVLEPPATLRTLLVAEPDSTAAYFLKRALSLNARVELSTVAPGGYVHGMEADLIIFCGFAPPELPLASAIFFGAAPPLPGVSLDAEIPNPPIIATDAEHPLMRFLNPSNVSISKARALSLPSDAQSLMSTQGGTLIADVSREGRRYAVAAFGIEDTNWPLRLSFPLFLQNLTAWALPRGRERDAAITAGEPLAIVAENGAASCSITLPDGARESLDLDPTRPSYFARTARTGLYRVSQNGIDRTYAVNLLNAAESAISPADTIMIGRGEVQGVGEATRENRELWRWLVAAAMTVLVIEWWLYSRRAWI